LTDVRQFKQRSRVCLVLVTLVALAGCGEESGEDTQSASAPQPHQDPVAQAQAYGERWGGGADKVAAATSGCYFGLTGDYLGPPGLTLEKEFPEPHLQAVFRWGERNCRKTRSAPRP